MWRTLAMPLLLATACAPDPPHLDSPGRTIICFGDSITAGVGAPEGASYPEELGRRLGVDVIAAGYPGATAGEAAARLAEVLAHDPWLVVVELGGNDFLRRVPIGETERALRATLERLLQARILPVLVEFDVPLVGPPYDDLFERLAKEYGVPLVAGALREILTDPGLKGDEIHPNAAGYRRLAAAVADTVEPLLAARRKRAA